MKITDVSWRARIGGSKVKHGKNPKQPELCTAVLKCVCASLITTLLIIGNIETNPGPAKLESIGDDLLYDTIIGLASNNEDYNHRRTGSIFGACALALGLENCLKIRNSIKTKYEQIVKTKLPSADVSMEIPSQANGSSPSGDREREQTSNRLDTMTPQTASNLINSVPDSSLTKHYWLKESLYGAALKILRVPNTLQNRERLANLRKAFHNEPSTSISDLVRRKFSSKAAKKAEKNKIRLSEKRSSLGGLSTAISPPAYYSTTAISDSQPPIPTVDPTFTTIRLIRKYNNEIMNFATIPCQVCDKLMYKDKVVNFVVNNIIQAKFLELGKSVDIDIKLSVCIRCRDNMKSGKISPQALANRMELPAIPEVISRLSMTEIRLISQVKPYMKMFMLSRGWGQRALKGMVVHFPQCVDEVVHQLPLNLVNCNLVVVNETLDGLDTNRELKIRPNFVYEALRWLKLNNPLYSHIDIVDREIEPISSICIQKENIPGNRLPHIAQLNPFTFSEVRPGVRRLRASFHQGYPRLAHPGQQCTAICAVFIAHCAVHNPSEWDCQTFDDIIIRGDRYYGERRPQASQDLFEVNEAMGLVTNVFQRQSVTLEADFTIQLQGIHPASNVPNMASLPETLTTFINLPSIQYGILTLRGVSLALMKDSDYLYLMDSHSRGPSGWIAKESNGKAIILQYSFEQFRISYIVQNLSTLIYHNCPVPKLNPAMPTHIRMTEYGYTVILIKPNVVSDDIREIENEGDEIDDIEGSMSQLVVSPNNSPAKKKPKEGVEEDDDDDLMHSQDITETRARAQDNVFDGVGNFVDYGMDGNLDCVIDNDDFCEPTFEAFKNAKKLNLHRKTGRPLNNSREEELDLLAFPNIFPHGKNGVNTHRLIHSTKLDYYQQRVMCSDRRFIGNTDFLFYALSETEKSKIEQKIAVCCQMRKEGAGPDTLQDPDIPVGAQDPHLYMSAIRGSASYWKKYRGDLIAMIGQLGIPHIFLTFSFDDLNSVDSITALYKAEYGPDAIIEDPSSLEFSSRKELLNNHPVTAARHSHMKFCKFLALLKSNAKDIFGFSISDYSLRVEFQGRGSAHAHSLLWLDGAPDLNGPHALDFIDKNISCSLSVPFKDQVIRFQQHRHTGTCYKNKKDKCRFQFPRKVTPVTEIVSEDDVPKNGGRFVHLKRTPEERMINNYHPMLLQILKCNMDIQPVTGAMAIVYYIAKYMSKSEPTELKNSIQESIQKVNESGHLIAQQKMRRISNIIMKHREIGAPEAAYRMCHLFLKTSSRLAVFIPTFRKENRLRMIQKETIGTGDPKFCHSMIDRYMARPDSLNHICLFEFAAHYSPVSGKNSLNEGDDDEEEPEDELEASRPLKLKNKMGYIHKRKRPAVVKSPNFDPVKDKDSYYYSMVLRFYPFRVENFCDPPNIPSEVFERLRPQFRKTEDDPIINVDLVKAIDSALLRVAALALDDENNIELEQDVDVFIDNLQEEEPLTPQEVFQAPQILIDARQLYSTLSPDQREVVDIVKDKLCNPAKPPVRLIVSGEAGTGKSYTIGAVQSLIANCSTPDSVLICAPTGIAAFLIKGLTMHRAFSLGVELGKLSKYNRLGAAKLAELRRVYRATEWIIIDEMSMVNYHTLRQVHLRLCEIFESDEPFGNRNVLIFGDLLQLKPPRGTWIFDQPEIYRSEAHLWRMCDFIELTQAHRQTGADPLLGICSRLRVGKLETSDIEILQERVLHPSRNDYQQRLTDFKDATYIYPKLAQVKKHNEAKNKELGKLYTLKAVDTYAEGTKYGSHLPSQLAPTDEKHCAGFSKTIELGVGSRVMLRRNIDTRTGLVNGAMGTVVGFTWTALRRDQLKHGDMPEYVHVEFDHLRVHGQPPRVTKIGQMTANFYGKKNTLVTRRAIPLILAFAVNCHKLQGVTLDKAVVYLGRELFAKGMAYVSISRVKTLNGLLISNLRANSLLSDSKFMPCELKALNELARLREARDLRMASRN